MSNPFYTLLAIVLRFIVRSVGRIIFRIRVKGDNIIPSHSGALLVANHTSYMDFVLVVTALNRPVSFVMNADVYNRPALRWIFKGLGFIPVSSGKSKEALEEFNQTVATQIKAGKLVIIFAEGTVTRTGQILEFKRGVEHLSSRFEEPVIPLHFYNVAGSPFSFRGGKRRMEGFRWSNLRKDVFLKIGVPAPRPIQAFQLRQLIKEMEVDNMTAHLRQSPSLQELFRNRISELKHGAWIFDHEQLSFAELELKIQKVARVLDDIIPHDKNVALLIPKSEYGFVVHLALMLSQRTAIPISRYFTNEEQYHVMRKSAATVLISTKRSDYIDYTPAADRMVYIEDIQRAVELGEGVPSTCKIRQSVAAFFRPQTFSDLPVVTFFEKTAQDEMRCVSLTHRHLLAVIQGLRQVYYFEKGGLWITDLPMHQAFGYVLELLMPVLHDARIRIVSSTISAAQFMDELEELKPSIVIATPKQLHSISQLAFTHNLPYLTHVFTADLSPNHADVISLRSRGIDVHVCAGSNATASVFAVNLADYVGRDIAGKILHQENNNTSSVGKPLPGIALKVCNEQGEELAADEWGEIWVKGPCVASILGDNHPCKIQLRNGWYNTGRVGALNQQGFILEQ